MGLAEDTILRLMWPYVCYSEQALGAADRGLLVVQIGGWPTGHMENSSLVRRLDGQFQVNVGPAGAESRELPLFGLRVACLTVLTQGCLG